MKRPRRSALRPTFDHLDERWLPSGLTASQLITAYNLTNYSTKTTDNGAGETIAIVDAYHDPSLAQDVNTFDTTSSKTGLTDLGSSTSSFLSVDDLAGSSTNAGWAGEEELDVEVAHAIAPGAKIVVVEAKSASISDLMNAVKTASSLPGVSVVSMSWGGSEFSGETSYDSDFQKAGVTFVASAGDSPGTEYPASSPYVVSVGGTTLTLNSSGGIASEKVWSDSGGGTSRYETKPSYQSSLSGSGRTTPDVSFDGDPNTGINVYITGNSIGQAGWYTVGGTSVGAPAWAGIFAITNEGLQSAGKSVLNTSSSTQTLSLLYGLGKSSYSSVTSTSSSGGFGGFFGGFFGSSSSSATPALGSPNGNTLISGLIGEVTGSGSSSSSSSGTSKTTTTTTTSSSSGSSTVTQRPTQGPVTPPPTFGGPYGGWFDDGGWWNGWRS